MTGVDWGELFSARKSIRTRFGEIWDLPVARRYHTVLSRLGRGGIAMLEVGAGSRSLKDKMHGVWGEFDYRSCDIDPGGNHDFAHIDEVEGSYDLICALEIIEHLELAEARHLLETCFKHTSPGGTIALTTPNIYYPPDFLRDATHKTPFCYDELGGLLAVAGYEVKAIYRLYHDALLKKLVRRILLYPVFRAIGIDFARQVMVVAERPA